MNKINERITEIIRLLNTEYGSLTDTNAIIEKCHDPVSYIKSFNPNRFPLILVSYKGNAYDMKLYPGITSFDLYFMDFKINDDALLDFAETVFLFLKTATIKTYTKTVLTTGHKMILQSQDLFAESNDQVIYVQKYKLLIP